MLGLQSLNNKQTKIGDVFSNPQLDLGFGSDDPNIQGLYPNARTLTWNLQRIEAVMRADPFFTRALDYRSSKPLIKGIDISSSEIDSERLDELHKNIKRKLNPGIKEGLFNADGFGWAGILIVIDGQMNKRRLSTPLKKEEITKNKFLGIKPLVRWYQINPSKELVTELGEKTQIFDPRELGQPLYYMVSFDGDKGKQYKVHRSRLILPVRNTLSYIEKKVEHYGGTSLLEQAFESLSRYHSLVAMVHRILNKSVIPVLKMEDISATALQSEKAQEMVENKIDVMRRQLSSNNLFVIGDGDEISFEQANLAGLGEQMKEARTELASALNTPQHELFEDVNKQDNQNEFNSFIQERQDFDVYPMYERLIPILYASMYGEQMPEFSIKFKPLETPTMKELAEARKTNIEAMEILYKNGIINAKTFQNSLSDIDSNPTDMLRNLDPEYMKYIESMGVEEGYHTAEIRLAEALNQGKDGSGAVEAKQKGKQEGGDKEKPTPKVPLNKSGEGD